MDIIIQTKPIARKQYKCDWCGLTIEKGEKHESQILKDETIYNWRNHLRCAEIARKLDMFDFCDNEGLTKDAFQNIITDKYCSIANISIANFDDYCDLPDFKIQLDAVCAKYLTTKTKKK